MSTGPRPPSTDSLAVCAQCCHANPPGHHFCESCNTPLSSLAAILPAWRPWAEGYLVRRAVRRADRWLVLIGMWLLFAPPIVWIGQMATWDIVRETWTHGEFAAAIVGTAVHLIFSVVILLICGSILALTTRSFYQNRARKPPSQSQE